MNWNTTKKDARLIEKIANKASTAFSCNMIDITMDITACHKNGNPLRLQELLEADDFNFGHDVLGINKHINRDTGKLQNCFVPRFSKLSRADVKLLERNAKLAKNLTGRHHA